MSVDGYGMGWDGDGDGEVAPALSLISLSLSLPMPYIPAQLVVVDLAIRAGGDGPGVDDLERREGRGWMDEVGDRRVAFVFSRRPPHRVPAIFWFFLASLGLAHGLHSTPG